jgi:hypothetical protein
MSTLNVNKINDSSGGVLAPISSVMRNRIINGAMVIDQRNAGASVTGNGYPVDRWQVPVSQSGKLTAQQNAGSVTPPAGFVNYVGITSSSAYSITSSDYFLLGQKIEGYNIADLGWGTASAKTVTLSFQVYSSLTGTFGGVMQNSAQTRSYPFTYTISSANTWTPISITVAGDTTGTWLTTNGIGIALYFGLGVGSTNSGTAGAWAGANYNSATGATSVVGTNGATFYITGVQLEVGTQATSFEYRQYGAELALCQRYFEQINNTDTGSGVYAVGFAYPFNTQARMYYQYLVPKRAQPTLSSSAGSTFLIQQDGVNLNVSNTISTFAIGQKTAWLSVGNVTGLAQNACVLLIGSGSGNAFINFSAEL